MLYGPAGVGIASERECARLRNAQAQVQSVFPCLDEGTAEEHGASHIGFIACCVAVEQYYVAGSEIGQIVTAVVVEGEAQLFHTAEVAGACILIPA